MNMYGEVVVQLHVFLKSAWDGGEWLASHPGRFTPGERELDTHWIDAGWAPESVWRKVTVINMTKILDNNHRPKSFETRRFGNWICFRYQVARWGVSYSLQWL